MKKLLCLLLAVSLVCGCSSSKAPDEGVDSGKFKAGTYSAEANGHNAKYEVKVTVSEDKIEKIEAINDLETIGVGKYAISELSEQIIEKQSVAVDNIAGASVTSTMFKSAVEEALGQATTDLSLVKTPISKTGLENEYTADVVVIGGGGAGLAAAISAEQNGANVIVIEKLGLLGGSTNVSEGALNAVDDKRQTAQGIEDSIEKHYTQTLEGGHDVGTPELVEVMVNNAYGAVEWLESIGVEFKEEIGTATGALWQRSHYPSTPSGNSYIRVFEDYTDKTDNIRIFRNTDAKSLVVDESGKVVGVKAINNEKEVVFKAENGVIISTGGFGGNIELRQEVNTGVWSHVNLDSSIGTTNMILSAQGDGIAMGQEIGAQVVGMSDLQIHPCGDINSGLMVDIRTSGRNRIFVNNDGARFVNEGAARDVLANAIFEQEDSTYWIVVNSLRYPDRNEPDRNGSTIANMVAQGKVVEAETLEELASKTGMDYETLKASVDGYNSVVRGDAKDELGFEANNEADKELLEGPWYANAKVPTVHHTMGGLKINTETQVLNENDEVIKGLYAAGEVTGGIHGSNRLGGNAITDCMVFGKIAGENAALGK